MGLFRRQRARRAPREGILRRRVLLLTVLPLGLLIGLSLLLVQQRVLRHIVGLVQSELGSAQAVWNEMVRDQKDEIRERGWIISRDPKFFALLTIPPEERREEFGPSLDLVMEDFRAAVAADLFEVYDERGVRAAGGPPRERVEPARHGLPTEVREALDGTPGGTIAIAGGRVVQIEAVPIVAGGSIVGALRLGLAIDREFALRFKDLTGCDVALVDPERPDTALLETSASPPARALTADAALFPTAVRVRFSRDLSSDLSFVAGLRRSLIEVAVLILLLTFVTGLWLSRSITVPVKQILDAAREMERGAYDASIEVRTGDELEQLARRFVEMRRVIGEQIQELKELDQMKSDFLTLASHELRTPLTGLVAYADLLGSGTFGEVPGEQRQAVGQIQESAQTLTRVVEQITDMTLLDRRQLSLNRAPHAVADLLSTAAARRREDCAARQLTLLVRAPQARAGEAALQVDVDVEKILQVLDNLLHNAIRFTPACGTIRLEAEASGGRVTLCVSDTGIGIAPEAMRHLFEPFYDARDLRHHRSGRIEFNTGGLGLGLAIARAIVRGHGGELTVQSRIQEGSSFRFTLPIAREPEAMREAA